MVISSFFSYLPCRTSRDRAAAARRRGAAVASDRYGERSSKGSVAELAPVDRWTVNAVAPSS